MADMLQFNQKPDSDNKSNAPDTSRRRYSSDEVADIIRISLQQETTSADHSIDHDELISIGKEVGVTAAQIEQSVHLLEEQQKTRDKEKLLWLRFKAHGAIFIAVNMLCIALNLMTSTEVFWSGYVLLGWGLFLLGHYAGLRYAPEFVEMAMARTKLVTNSKYQELIEDNVNVSFTVADTSGLMGSEGIVFIEGDQLMIEHQTSDALLGLLKSGIKEAAIPITDITSARLEQKFWSSDLVLTSRSLKIFRHVPGNSSGGLRLKINRQSGAAARNLVDQINTFSND